MPTPEELKDQARAQARNILSQSQAFLSLPRSEQMEMYKHIIDEQYQQLVRQNNPNLAQQSSLAAGFAADIPKRENANIKGAGNLVSDLVKKVDFPSFVRDLLVGVFDANLDANDRQMNAYKDLLREATRDVSAFVKEVDDTEALYRLVQDSKNEYQLDFSDADTSATGTPIVKDRDGNEVDSNVIKTKLFEAKLAMAKERRTLLRETLLMGISRLVVEKGTIKAQVNFSIDATENTKYYDRARGNDTFTEKKSSEDGYNSGFWGGLHTNNKRENTSKISITTGAKADTTNDTKLHADMMGSVEIQFKSDYFKLDNFTQIFDLGQGQVPQGAAGKQKSLPSSDES